MSRPQPSASAQRNPVVCHLSSVHRVSDVRIFHKECETLAAAGLDVTLIGVDAPVRSDRVKVIPLPPAKGRIKRIALHSRDAYRMAMRTRADIYHFHDPELLPFGLLLKKRTGARVIFDSHECFREDVVEKDWIPSWLRGAVGAGVGVIEDAVVSRIDQVVAATPHIGDFFSSRAKRVVVVNNYPLPHEFVASEAATEGRSGVCYAGAMSPARGLMPFLDALSLVPPSVPVHVAGIFASGAFEAAARSHPNWQRVTFHGQVGRADLARIYRSCLAGIVTFLPAPNHIHSQPNKLFEYMAAGLAVIGSRFPLWAQVIEDGRSGLCVDPASPEQIAQAINRVASDPAAASEMGKRGSDLVRTRYNWEPEGRRLVASYHDLLAN